MSRSGEELERALQVAEHRVTELQAWVDSGEAETDQLRARVAELEATAPGPEADALRARATAAEEELARVKARFELLSGSVEEGAHFAAQNRQLVERLSTLESLNHSLRGLNTHLVEQIDSSAHRDMHRLALQLEEARAAGSAARVAELEQSLAAAREAVATLEAQREAAVDQVRRYVDGDSVELTALTAQLAEQQALGAAAQRRAEAAEQALGTLRSELEALREHQAPLQAQVQDLAHKLEEAKRWLAQGELETAELEKALEAAKSEVALRRAAEPPPPPADATDPSELEGFSAQHLHRLEAQLAGEKVKSEVLLSFLATSEASLARTQDELMAAGGKLADLAKRLGFSAAETGETNERLDAARRELHALLAELTLARAGSPSEAEGELIAPEDVLDAPLAALEDLAQQQAGAAQEATQALAGEQRARDQLMGDLTWLKTEFEKLTTVREDLRARLGAMVQRELRRKQVVSALLDKLRGTEVAAAARAGTLRRLHAALESAQRTAVRVQTVYFQKQIGSLQRQLETVLGMRSAIPRLVRSR